MNTIANLDFKIRTNGGAAIRGLDAVGRRASNLSRQFSGIGTALGGLGIIQLGRGAARLSDEFTNTAAKLQLLAKTQEEATQLQAAALRIATATRSELGASATIMTRLGRSAERFGGSQDQVLAVAQAIQETFKISGSTIQESEAATLQLAQSLGKGVLNGDELRSVLENNLYIAQIIAAEFGVSVDQLKELGAQGKLTSKRVFGALLKDSQEINNRFAQLPKTFGDSASLIGTSATVLIGQINKSTNASEGLFRSIQKITEQLITASLIDITQVFVKAQAAIRITLANIGQLVAGVKKFGLEAKLAFENLTGTGVESDLAKLGDLKETRARLKKSIADIKATTNTGVFAPIIDGLDALRAYGDGATLSGIERQIRAIESGSTDTARAVQNAADEVAGFDAVIEEVKRQSAEKITTSALDVTEFVKAYKEATAQIEAARSTVLEGGDGIDTDKPKKGPDIKQVVTEAKALELVIEDVSYVAEGAFQRFFDNLDQGFQASAKAFAGTWLSALQDIVASRLASQFAELLLGSNGNAASGGNVGGVTGAAIGGVKKLFGFRNGGDFRVGGSGGADSQRVSFLATPNERVSIKTPAQQKADGQGSISINQVLNVDGGVSPAQFEQAMLRQKKATIAEMQQLKSQGRF